MSIFNHLYLIFEIFAMRFYDNNESENFFPICSSFFLRIWRIHGKSLSVYGRQGFQGCLRYTKMYQNSRKESKSMRLWGLRIMSEILCITITTGSVYPFSEHVDIFPVRLVSTFHRVSSVYLTLAVYLTQSSLSLRAE